MQERDERHSPTAEGTARAAQGETAINSHLARHIEDEVSRQLASLNLTRKVWGELGEFQRRLKVHHKIAYGTMVFLGVLLMWYGTWGLIAGVPVLKLPPVALATGITLLALTGVLYSKLTA